jgi:ribokinase
MAYPPHHSRGAAMTASAVSRPVVIDTDPGVDDALALMLALRSPEFRVELITTVAGNVPVETATNNARHILALAQPSVWPVLAQGAARPLRRPLRTATGDHGSDGLGGLTRLRRQDGSLRYPVPQHPVAHRRTVQRLVQMVETYGNDLTVIALGPLTNIARAVQRAPEIMRQLGQLVIMGGAINVPGNVSPAAEFNIYVDPHAADVVLSAGLPVTLVPLDVTRQVRLTRTFFQETVRGPGSALAQATRQMTRYVLHRSDTPGLAMHDPLAVAVAIDPSLVQLTPLPVRVETQGQHTLGMTVADRRNTLHRIPEQSHLNVALDVDAPRVLAMFAERVLTGGSGQSRPSHRRAEVVVVGSANTDLVVRAPHLPTPGETVLGSALQATFGGKGANQAVAARRAGAGVALLARLGRDAYGQEYAAHLRREGVDIAGVQLDDSLPSGVALITVDRHGQNLITVAPGANAALTPDALDGLTERLASARVLLTQLETPLETVETALRRARAAGVTTVLNPAPARRIPARLARLVDILVPNAGEAALLCGQPVHTLRQAHTAARQLRQQGYRTAVITLGKRGLVYTDGEDTTHLPGHEIQASDTTAAGDTFVGYLACALAQGQALQPALTFANAAAALAVTRAGAQPSIPHRRDVQRFQTANQQRALA